MRARWKIVAEYKCLDIVFGTPRWRIAVWVRFHCLNGLWYLGLAWGGFSLLGWLIGTEKVCKVFVEATPYAFHLSKLFLKKILLEGLPALCGSRP